MNIVIRVLGIGGTIVWGMVATSNLDNPLLLAASPLWFIAWRIVEKRGNKYLLGKTATTYAYLLLGAALVLVSQLDRHPDSYWFAIGAGFTLVLVARTWVQEAFYRAHKASLVAAGTMTFSEERYLRNVSPPLFRWAHRVLALWFIWTMVTGLAAVRPRAEIENPALLVVPFLFVLLLGPWATIPTVVLFPVTLVFLVTGPALLWVGSSFVWLFVSAIKRPTDRRTNNQRAFFGASTGWPWYYAT